MQNDSLAVSSGQILLSTEWAQDGLIPDSSVAYNEYCPADPEDGRKSLTGCTNTAAAQILYYWLETSDFTIQLQLTQNDSYSYISCTGQEIVIDASEETASQNNYRSFADVNRDLQCFTIGDASDIASLCFACGIVQEANYSSTNTSTPWNKDLFLRSGMSGITELSPATNAYFYDSDSDRTISCAVFDVLIDELLAGHPIGTSNIRDQHALVLDGYDSTTGLFHINYGWGGFSNGWYSREEINEQGFHLFYLDVTPDYDESPILVTNSASYGVGTFLRGMDQLEGITDADTLTVQSDCSGSDVSISEYWSFNKDIVISNFNANIVSDCGIVHNEKNLTINGLSGTIENHDAVVFYAGGDVTITDLSGAIKSASSAINAIGNVTITDLSGLILSSDQHAVAGAASLSLQNFNGVCITAGNTYSYSFRSYGKLTAAVNGGKVFSCVNIPEDTIAVLEQDLTVFGEAGVEKAIQYNTKISENAYSFLGFNDDDMILAKNHAVIQGGISLKDGNDTVSVSGGSYVYAPVFNSVEVLTIDSTATVSGVFYGTGADSMTVNMIITAETPSSEMIRIQDCFYNFYDLLKEKTLCIDLRAASDGEYVLINASGLENADYFLSRISAKIDTGSGSITLSCGESSNGISLKCEEGKLFLTLDCSTETKAEALLFNDGRLMSVTESVSGKTISSDGTDSLRLANGGSADCITVSSGGDLSISASGSAANTLVDAYGFLAVNSGGRAINTTVKEHGIMNLGKSAFHTGWLFIEENAMVRADDSATIDFDVSGFSDSTYHGINDFSASSPVYEKIRSNPVIDTFIW